MHDDDKMFKRYRIGDFAKYLGVTSDFLKHYEEAGLINVVQRASGYRYYPFDQSARVIEYMRLRNYGVTVKEMKGVLTGNAEEAFALLDERADAMRETVRRLNAILAAHEELKAWFERRRQKPIDWEIREVEPHYFLPHTNTQSFRKDEGVYELVRTWGLWLPVTKSALTIEPSFVPDDPEALHWGFAVPKSRAIRYGLPVNGVGGGASLRQGLRLPLLRPQGRLQNGRRRRPASSCLCRDSRARLPCDRHGASHQ